MHKGKLKGIKVKGSNTDLCLQQFADDTNAVMQEDDQSVQAFGDCLNTFCLASGSIINHTKTGFKSLSGNMPMMVKQAGCKFIENCQVFRLLGIPMGFGISYTQRWEFVVSKFRSKVLSWQNYQPNLSARSFVLNHYLLPSLIYFLACWKPAMYQLNQIHALARQFLWGGEKKIPKVSWKICCTPKDKGGLGILDIERGCPPDLQVNGL